MGIVYTVCPKKKFFWQILYTIVPYGAHNSRTDCNCERKFDGDGDEDASKSWLVLFLNLLGIILHKFTWLLFFSFHVSSVLVLSYELRKITLYYLKLPRFLVVHPFFLNIVVCLLVPMTHIY